MTSLYGGERVAFFQVGVGALCQFEEGDDLAQTLFKLNIPNLDFFCLPVNDSRDLIHGGTGTHWTLLSWQRGVGFSHQDSKPNIGSKNEFVARLIASRLGPLLGEPFSGNFIPIHCAIQSNSFDCGDHVLCNMERLAREHATGCEVGGQGMPPPVEVECVREEVLRVAKLYSLEDPYVVKLLEELSKVIK